MSTTGSKKRKKQMLELIILALVAYSLGLVTGIVLIITIMLKAMKMVKKAIPPKP